MPEKEIQSHCYFYETEINDLLWTYAFVFIFRSAPLWMRSSAIFTSSEGGNRQINLIQFSFN